MFQRWGYLHICWCEMTSHTVSYTQRSSANLLPVTNGTNGCTRDEETETSNPVTKNGIYWTQTLDFEMD